MFGKRPGEDVPALVVGDKVERVPGGRMKRRADGGFARIRNWSGGQPRVAIGVVRGIELEIGLGNWAYRVVLELCRVDHGRIALQRHPQLEAPLENSRDKWAF